MTVHEARHYVGKDCLVTWQDRYGRRRTINTRIHKLGFVPLYGPFIMGDADDLYLRKVTRIQPLD